MSDSVSRDRNWYWSREMADFDHLQISWMKHLQKVLRQDMVQKASRFSVASKTPSNSRPVASSDPKSFS
jgi:hypothetical protein